MEVLNFKLYRTQVPVTTLYTMTLTLHLTLILRSPIHMVLSVQGWWGWLTTASVELE